LKRCIKIGLKHYIEKEINHLDKKIGLVFKEHKIAIKRARKIVGRQSRMLEQKLADVQKLVYIGLGIMLAIELLFKFLLK
jgi:hypothetical protein